MDAPPRKFFATPTETLSIGVPADVANIIAKHYWTIADITRHLEIVDRGARARTGPAFQLEDTSRIVFSPGNFWERKPDDKGYTLHPRLALEVMGKLVNALERDAHNPEVVGEFRAQAARVAFDVIGAAYKEIVAKMDGGIGEIKG